jgi:hypothetical protein
MSYENIWEKRGVYRKYSGRVTGKEILRAVQAVEGDARFESVRYVINDFLDVTEQDISPEDIKIIAAIDNAAALTNPDIRVAVVATMEAIQKMAALYIELSIETPYLCEMFTSLSEGRGWATSKNRTIEGRPRVSLEKT